MQSARGPSVRAPLAACKDANTRAYYTKEANLVSPAVSAVKPPKRLRLLSDAGDSLGGAAARCLQMERLPGLREGDGVALIDEVML
eukprot:COSAG01_NODE_5723_length_4074_cov_49.724277_5_plen_86_part_00